MSEMIRTKSIYDPKEENDGIRILITRYWPRGIKKEYFDKWYKELSPSRDLLKIYKDKKIDFSLFGRLFLQEIIFQMKENQFFYLYIFLINLLMVTILYTIYQNVLF